MENKPPLLTEVIEAYEKGEIEKNFEGAIICRPFEGYDIKNGFWVSSGFIEDWLKNKEEITKAMKQEEFELMWGANYKVYGK